MNDRRETFRKRVISALDLGVAASFAWVVATAWFGVFGVRTMSTQVVQQTVGWYGKTVSLWEANTVYAFLGYAVLFHVGMLALYWLVRRGRSLAPTASDILAITCSSVRYGQFQRPFTPRRSFVHSGRTSFGGSSNPDQSRGRRPIAMPLLWIGGRKAGSVRQCGRYCC